MRSSTKRALLSSGALLAVILTACTERGLAELDAARALGNGQIAWDEELRREFGSPEDIQTRYGAQRWLLRRAIEVGSRDVAVAARHHLATTVDADSCSEAEELLRANAGDGASERLLAELTRDGCRAYLERAIAATQDALLSGRMVPNELTDEWLRRAKIQLAGLSGSAESQDS